MDLLTKLRLQLIAEAVKDAEPISEVYSHRSMTNRWRRYDKRPAELIGFVARGDAACAFNPVYGQGMTTGALSALTLRDTIVQLGLEHPKLAGKFYTAQAQIQKAPWGNGDRCGFRGFWGGRAQADVESDLRSDIRAHHGVLGRSGRSDDCRQSHSHVAAAVGFVRAGSAWSSGPQHCARRREAQAGGQ